MTGGSILASGKAAAQTWSASAMGAQSHANMNAAAPHNYQHPSAGCRPTWKCPALRMTTSQAGADAAAK